MQPCCGVWGGDRLGVHSAGVYGRAGAGSSRVGGEFARTRGRGGSGERGNATVLRGAEMHHRVGMHLLCTGRFVLAAVRQPCRACRSAWGDVGDFKSSRAGVFAALKLLTRLLLCTCAG
jgi:hypothetical protein